MEGLNKFKEAFSAYADNYVIIGGTACEIVMSGTDIQARFVKVLRQDWASLGTQLAQALDNSEAFVSALLEQLDNLFIEEA